MQRALLQYFDPSKYELVRKALIRAGRRDLIGNSPKCLIKDIPLKNGFSERNGKNKNFLNSKNKNGKMKKGKKRFEKR